MTMIQSTKARMISKNMSSTPIDRGMSQPVSQAQSMLPRGDESREVPKGSDRSRLQAVQMLHWAERKSRPQSQGPSTYQRHPWRSYTHQCRYLRPDMIGRACFHRGKTHLRQLGKHTAQALQSSVSSSISFSDDVLTYLLKALSSTIKYCSIFVNNGIEMVNNLMEANGA